MQDSISPGAGVLMDLQMGEEPFSLEGRVVRKIPQKDGRDLIGVAFINLDDKTHELLARHVHRLQLERRRNSIQ